MEELLREAACVGNLQAVQRLLQSGASVNSRNIVNGWTALHWACRREHREVVRFLLQSGADVTAKTNKGELPSDLCSPETAKILDGTGSSIPKEKSSGSLESQQAPPIVPNYLAHPVFPYYDVSKRMKKEFRTARSVPEERGKMSSWEEQEQELEESSFSSSGDGFGTGEEDCVSNNSERMVGNAVMRKLNSISVGGPEHHRNSAFQGLPVHDEYSGVHRRSASLCSSSSGPPSGPQLQPGLLVKVRVAESGESDFVEVELSSLCYAALLQACCEELGIQPSDVAKIRKLPNVLVRKDKDVVRFRGGEEIEMVLTDDMENCT